VAKVFISYSSKDEKFVTRLVRDLRHVGHDVWHDAMEIVPGQDIAQKISDGIRDAEYFVLVLTPDAMRSGWVSQEWQAAFTRHVHGRLVFIPVMRRRCSPPVLLQGKNYADFTGKYMKGFAALARALDSPMLDRTGLEGAFSTYDGTGIDWPDFFADATSLTTLFAYAHWFWIVCRQHLETFVAKEGARLRVILPDPNDETVVAALEHHHAAGSDVRKKIEAAIDGYQGLAQKHPGVVEIRLIPRLPSLAFFLFDDRVIYTLNSNRPGKQQVLALVARRHGSVYDYFAEEAEGIIEAYPALEAPAEARKRA
jgi:hypothetical protein